MRTAARRRSRSVEFLLGGCWADFVPRAGRRGGHAKLGRSIGGDRADLAGGDFNGTVLHHAAHHAENGKNGDRLERAGRTDSDAGANVAGRYAAEDFHHGKRRGAYRLSGARAGAEDGSRVYGCSRSVSRAAAAHGSDPDRNDGSGGGRGSSVQAQFLETGAAGVSV